MRNEALYQKYRSQAFDEVVGQEYVVRSIHNAVKNDKVGHAYLFCGPRGTGKTTMARLLARAVNCENKKNAPCGECANCVAAINNTHPDIVEINAANETHVEDVRDLIERARLAPMMGQKKIYIIDEVHQLSSSAASALLKTLEEPPEHVIFILATTDPQKLLGTIISRCQRFDFSKVATDKIKEHLLFVANKEDIKLEEAAALKIAQLADGGMRDALSMLEQATSYAERDIKEDDIDQIYGLASTQDKIDLIEAILNKDLATILERSEEYTNRGIDLKRLTSELLDALKDSVIYFYTKNESLLRTIRKEDAEHIQNHATTKQLMAMIDVLMKAQESYRTAQSMNSVFEVACMNMLVNEEPVQQTIQTPQPEVKEEPKKTKVVKKEAPAVKTLDVDTILRLLVQCDKDSKAEDDAKLKTLCESRGMDRYIATLNQATLKASGADCILLTADTQAVINNINEDATNKALYDYIKKEADIDKMIFATTNEEYDEAVQKFIECRKSNTLPDKLVVERYINEEEKGEIKSSLEKLQEAFQDDDILKVYD